MTTPTQLAAAVTAVAAIYLLTGHALGARRRRDPVLWIGASMAGVLLVGSLAGPLFGEPTEAWQGVAALMLGMWARRRWQAVPAASTVSGDP